MKKRLLFQVLCTLLIVISVKAANSQSVRADSIVSYSIFFESNCFVNLSKSKKPKDILIDVKKGALKLNLQIGCIVNSGSLLFDIYDPNGKKKDGLPLMNTRKSQLDVQEDFFAGKSINPGSRVKYEGTKDSLKLQGHFVREFLNPLPGKWVIKVIPKNVDGKFKIHHIVNMK